ncbi:MAG: hypothetical protein ABIJ92_00515 [Candidatus Aenigmatarchaeota archaeon]
MKIVALIGIAVFLLAGFVFMVLGKREDKKSRSSVCIRNYSTAYVIRGDAISFLIVGFWCEIIAALSGLLVLIL